MAEKDEPEVGKDLATNGEKLDLSISEGLSSVRAALEKLGETLGVEKPAESASLSTMPEIRAQALDNARVLWPILVVGQNLAARYLTQNVSVPPMTIITVGEGTAISAQVVYAEGQFPNKVGNWLFLRGPDSPSAAEAMQKLLAMTQSMLQDVYTKSVFVQGGLQVKHHPGGGAYYARQD